MAYTFSDEIVFCGELVVEHMTPRGLMIEMAGTENEFVRLFFICSGGGDYRFVGSFTKEECLDSGRHRQKIVDFLFWCVNVLVDNFTELVVFAKEKFWEETPVQVMDYRMHR